MDENVSVVLVGINGYGSLYLQELLSNTDENVHLSGVVDIYPESSDYYQEILDREIPVFQSIETFYDEFEADFAIISTPIHLHREQACFCMNQGSHVLCEKPMTANPADLSPMINTRDNTGKFLAIGFNWSFVPSILELKTDILNGKFGKPIRFKSMALWPRDLAYYHRSSWAGKKYDNNGAMIFDSVANNATAHFLHNLLYLTGDTIDTSGQPDTVTAELYRVNNIETFDTCAVQLKTKKDVDIYFYASHAVKENKDPCFQLEFENATITYDGNKTAHNIVAIWNDGTEKVYEGPEKYSHLTKLPVCIDAIRKQDNQIPCGPEAASAQVKSIQAMHESVSDVNLFPQSFIHYEASERRYWIKNLVEDLDHCYTNWSLPSDVNFEWSIRGRSIKINE